MLKVVCDDKIPFLKGVLEPYAKVVYLPGQEISAEIVKDADAIVTRTRTICDKTLLEGSSVKIITTATIGYDHIDTERPWLQFIFRAAVHRLGALRSGGTFQSPF